MLNVATFKLIIVFPHVKPGKYCETLEIIVRINYEHVIDHVKQEDNYNFALWLRFFYCCEETL